MNYSAWTWRVIKARCIEASETARLLPGRVGPSLSLTYWPEYRDDYKGGEPTRTTREQPTRAAISRMWEFVSWVNSELNETERRNIYQYGAIMASPHRNIRGYCKKNGLTEHIYRRRIEKIFQKLAANRNINREVRYSDGVDETRFLDENTTNSEIERTPSFIRYLEATQIPDAIHTLSRYRPAKNLVDRAIIGASLPSR